MDTLIYMVFTFISFAIAAYIRDCDDEQMEDQIMGYKIPDLKEDIQAAVFDYMDKYDCPQTFTDELRQTIAEDIAYDILDKHFERIER